MKVSKALLFLFFLFSLMLPGSLLAQEDDCRAIVFFGAPNGESGTNEGTCASEEDACATFEYALEQGQLTCGQEVHVIYTDESTTYEQLDWRPPTSEAQNEDRWLRFLSRVGPAPALLLGWLLGLGVAYSVIKRGA